MEKRFSGDGEEACDVVEKWWSSSVYVKQELLPEAPVGLCGVSIESAQPCVLGAFQKLGWEVMHHDGLKKIMKSTQIKATMYTI